MVARAPVAFLGAGNVTSYVADTSSLAPIYLGNPGS